MATELEFGSHVEYKDSPVIEEAEMVGRTKFALANLTPLLVRLTYALSGLAAKRVLLAREPRRGMAVEEIESNRGLDDTWKELVAIEGRQLDHMESIRKEAAMALSPETYEKEIVATKVFGVREAKNGLSQILKRASEGDWSVIASGQGKSVVVVSADQLLGSLEKRREVTLAEAIRLLPHKLERSEKPKMRGRPPRHGILPADRTGRQSTIGGFGHT